MAESRFRLITFDMDDTLYPELEYVRSGYTFVAGHIAEHAAIPADRIFQRLWWHFENGDRRRVFDVVLAEFNLSDRLAVASLVEMYRSHASDIHLRPEAARVLGTLRDAGVRLGVITDGSPVQQRAKAQALDLARYVDAIVFTGELPPGCAKPSPAAFEKLMRQFDVPARQCMYVADNPRKDFVGPRQLGWFTLQFMHETGIYCREVAPPGGEPHACIQDLREVLRHAAIG